jgi:hypothetical protein
MPTPTIVNAVIKLRRGLDSERKTITFDTGEIIYSTDKQKTFIGDGITQGGVVVGNHTTIGTIPSPSAVAFDTYYDKVNCITYVLSTQNGADNINNYARISPIADNITLKYTNGKFAIDPNYFNNPATGFVHLSGDTMNGYLTLHHKPISAMHAATKNFVDEGLSSLSASMNSGFVHLTGDDINGRIKVGTTFEVVGTSDFKSEVNFNDNFIKRFKPAVKTVQLDSVTDTYELLPADNGSVIVVKSSDIAYVSIPNGLPVGYNVLIVKKSTFTLSFIPKDKTITGVDIVNVHSRITIGSPYGVCNMIVIDTQQVLISGDLV